MNKRVIVIGGGAAGMIAALSAKENGGDVVTRGESASRLDQSLYLLCRPG